MGVPFKDPLGVPLGVKIRRLTTKHVIIGVVVIYHYLKPHTTLQNPTTRLYITVVQLTKLWDVTLLHFNLDVYTMLD